MKTSIHQILFFAFIMMTGLSGSAMAVDCTTTSCVSVTGKIDVLVLDYGNALKSYWGTASGIRATTPTTPAIMVHLDNPTYSPADYNGNCSNTNVFAMLYNDSGANGQGKATYATLMAAKTAMMTVQIAFSTDTADNCEIVSVLLPAQ